MKVNSVVTQLTTDAHRLGETFEFCHKYYGKSNSNKVLDMNKANRYGLRLLNQARNTRLFQHC